MATDSFVGFSSPKFSTFCQIEMKEINVTQWRAMAAVLITFKVKIFKIFLLG